MDEVLRVNRNAKYKTIHLKAVEDDRRLSWKAVGIHTFLISRPSGWKLFQADLLKRHTDGEAALRSGLKELEDGGYLKRVSIRDSLGKFIRRDWLVSERPLAPGEWVVEFPSS